MCEPSDRLDDVGALVHDDNCAGTKTGLCVFQGIIVHPEGDEVKDRDRVDVKYLQDFLALLDGQNRNGAASWDDPQQVVPASTDTTTVFLDKILQRNAHLLLYHARVVDMA